ncbi:hypothetical protein [Microbacterium esteraromaticum]|uniref:hypothetical protein n=1 Tax=Microbacterium esteraromaticum TaxID=57043 RepID=UPI001C96EBCA|nr:hypothetical protein [Microbacterium esteraromaticum]MBY6061010.1 hypothetical protein [Microbacterium esteraromaticum]
MTRKNTDEAQEPQTRPLKASDLTTRKQRVWITVAIAVGAVVIGGAIATPEIVHSVQHSEATSAFVASEQSLAEASAELTAAETRLQSAVVTAGERYTALKALSDVTPETYVADPALLADYDASLAEYAEIAELVLDDDTLNLVVADAEDADAEAEALAAAKPTPVKTPASLEALREQAVTLAASAEDLRDDAASYAAQADDIEEAYELILAQQRDIAESAHARGVELAGSLPEKADAKTKAAFTAAVAGLDTDSLAEDDDLAALVKTYVDAWGAAKQSHDAAVTKEKEAAAAKEAQRQQNTPVNRGGSAGGGSTGSHGHSGGSSSSSGGGGSSSSGGGGGSSSSGGGGGGGGGGGSSNSGGGQTPSIPNRGIIIKTSAACLPNYGSGGAVSANWASNLVVPHDAVITGTSENPGVSWSVSFACDF